MRTIERMILTAMALCIVAGFAWAFETPTLKEQPAPIFDMKVYFGLINATGTTSHKDIGSKYCSWDFTASRTGTGSIVIHLQLAKESKNGAPYGFVNATSSAGHTVDTDTDNLGFRIPMSDGHCGQYPRLKIESGADAFGNSLTNTVITGKVN